MVLPRVRDVALDPLLPARVDRLYGTSMAAEKFPVKLSNIFFMLGMQAVITERLYDTCSQIVGSTASQVKSLLWKRWSWCNRAGIIVTGHLDVNEAVSALAVQKNGRGEGRGQADVAHSTREENKTMTMYLFLRSIFISHTMAAARTQS